MKRLIPILLCTALGLSGLPVQAEDAPAGETLRQPGAFPGGPWKQIRNLNTKDMAYVAWMSSVSQAADTVQTSVFRYSPAPSAATVKEMDDNAAKEGCEALSNETLASSTENGYPAHTWKVTCRNADGSVKLVGIKKVIAGHDATYKIEKIWTFQPADDALRTWLAYFQAVQVCDARAKPGCPAG